MSVLCYQIFGVEMHTQPADEKNSGTANMGSLQLGVMYWSEHFKSEGE